MIDNKTPHLELPLPNLGNQQDEDVPRIAAALAGLDAHAAQSDARMAVAEAGLGGAVERVVVLEDDALEMRKGMGALSGRIDAVEAKSPDLASKNRAGTVKIGEGIAVTGDGTISVTPIDLASSEKAGTVKPGLGVAVTDDGTLNVSYWEAFPPYVPIPVWGVTFGGSDGRRAIMPGETSAREDWIRCDGGTNGKGGSVPELRNKFIRGVVASGTPSTGGAETHTHTVSGASSDRTLSQQQLAWHAHWYNTSNANNGPGQYQGDGGGPMFNSGVTGTWSGAMGDNAAHNHAISIATSGSSNLPPYQSMHYVMRVI